MPPLPPLEWLRFPITVERPVALSQGESLCQERAVGHQDNLSSPGPCETVSSLVFFKFLFWLKSRCLNPRGLLRFLSDPISVCVWGCSLEQGMGSGTPGHVCARRLRPLCHLAVGSPVPTGASASVCPCHPPLFHCPVTSWESSSTSLFQGWGFLFRVLLPALPTSLF